MTDGSLLVLATQYSFAVSFAAMAAGTLYFLMERANLTPDYSPVASLAAMVSFVAAINYYTMKDMVGLSGSAAELASFPTDFRYVDWLITTPLLLAMLPVLLGGKRFDTGLMIRLVSADVLMIAFGYVGEVSINNSGGGTMLSWWCLLASMVLWFYILYDLFAGIGRASEGAAAEVVSALGVLRTFVVVGWLVYPLGYVVAALDLADSLLVARELIYCIADVVNKVGFGMVAVAAAKRMSARQWQAGQPA
jgi:bacteriorhodopsin